MSNPNIYVLANVAVNTTDPTGTDNGETLGSGDDIFVAANVYVVDEANNLNSCAIYDPGWGVAQIDGAIQGYQGVVFGGTKGKTTTITIGTTGSVQSLGAGNGAVAVQTGFYSISNNGEIDSQSDGIDADYSAQGSSNGVGGGTIVNHGDIHSAKGLGAAIYIGDSQSGDTESVDNYGSIWGDKLATYGIADFGSSALDLTNQGSISGLDALVVSGSGYIVNSGSLSASAEAVYNAALAGSEEYLFNSGSITSVGDALFDDDGHQARNVNYGTISAGTGSNDFAVLADSLTQERLVNGGVISGAVLLGAANSTIVNSGSIDGDIAFGGAAGRFVNSGSVDGNISFTGAGNVYLGKGGSFTGTLTGTGVDGRYYAGVGAEKFDFTAIGAALAVGGTGETTFDYGATYNNSMAVQGGTGTTIVDVEGNYTGLKQIFLGAAAMVGVDKIVFGAGFSYALSVNAATVVNGATMIVDASQVGAGQTALLNISKDVGGFYDFVGGAGDDTITCAANNLFANDVFLGGTSAGNIINFKTAGTVLSPSFANVSGFSIINVASGANDIQLNDLMVTKANASHSLYLNLSTGVDTIDASLLITSTNNVTVNGTNASGGDTFIFGAARETVILPASVSSSVNYDTISNFNFGTGTPFDSLYVAGYSANAIDASVSGSLSTASFDADLATALAGHLNNGDALLFTANAGKLAGDTFLIASTNGAAGYAAGDLVVRLTGTTTGTLTAGNV